MSSEPYKSGEIEVIYVIIIVYQLYLMYILWFLWLIILKMDFASFFEIIYQGMYDLENDSLNHLEKRFLFHIYLKSSFVCNFGICTYFYIF